jgi:type II secretory pathway component PulK
MRAPTTPPHLRAPRTRPGERGIALLMVLLLSMILFPFAVQFALQVSLEARTAQNVTDQLLIENAIDGQLEIVLSRLGYDAGAEQDVDSLHDPWNSDEIRERREDETQVALSTRVFDEQGKFNVLLLARAPPDRRELVKQRLVRILAEFRRENRASVSESLAKELADAVSNFVSGTSSRRGIPKPKTVDDRAMLVLDELVFVHEKFAELLGDLREGDRVAPGLHRVLTVYGDGKVNLNTADPVVLAAFFPSDPDIAKRIVERRDSEPEEGAGDASGTDAERKGSPFGDVNQLMEVDGVTVELLQKDKVDPAADFTVRSSHFGVRIFAETTNTRRDELFVVERVRARPPNKGVEGFRYLLQQERTDPLEEADQAER